MRLKHITVATRQGACLVWRVQARDEVPKDAQEQLGVARQELRQVGVAHGPRGWRSKRGGAGECRAAQGFGMQVNKRGSYKHARQETCKQPAREAPRCAPDEHGRLGKARTGALEGARGDEHALDGAHAKVVMVLRANRLRGDERGIVARVCRVPLTRSAQGCNKQARLERGGQAQRAGRPAPSCRRRGRSARLLAELLAGELVERDHLAAEGAALLEAVAQQHNLTPSRGRGRKVGSAPRARLLSALVTRHSAAGGAPPVAAHLCHEGVVGHHHRHGAEQGLGAETRCAYVCVWKSPTGSSMGPHRPEQTFNPNPSSPGAETGPRAP